MSNYELIPFSASEIREDLQAWRRQVSEPGWTWYVKRLSGNDTLLNDSHQAGPYFPNDLVFELFPSIHDAQLANPRSSATSDIASHRVPEREIRAIWYNNKLRGGTRNECRLTNWGGRSSPLLDPESTGSIAVFALHKKTEGADADRCSVWLCTTVAEEEYLETFTGPVEPGRHHVIRHALVGPVDQLRAQESLFVQKAPHAGRFPDAWLQQFPAGQEVTDYVVALHPKFRRLPPDERLIRRRAAEYELFREVESAHAMPRIQAGFSDVDEFVTYANQMTNRRKARSGRSLEYQLKVVFEEEGLTGFGHDCPTEGRKRPDFLFPSQAAYHDSGFPEAELRMLAVKTTCKDRWRQVTTEADRISEKHLLTLQEGLTTHQFEEMSAQGVLLVVPQPLHRAYPKAIRRRLISLEEFIQEIR